jgi:hypothetical protein
MNSPDIMKTKLKKKNTIKKILLPDEFFSHNNTTTNDNSDIKIIDFSAIPFISLTSNNITDERSEKMSNDIIKLLYNIIFKYKNSQIKNNDITNPLEEQSLDKIRSVYLFQSKWITK